MTQLEAHDGNGGGDARCVRCGRTAVGPCARCHCPVCGDCSVLTEGGVRTYAICLGCDRSVGRSLGASWLVVIGWIAVPLIALLVAVLALAWLVPR